MTTALRVPSFNGIHNQVKVKALFIFYCYKDLSPGGPGLTSNDLAYILDVPHIRALNLLCRLTRWHYILQGSTPSRMGVKKQHIYRISSKGEQYLIRWNSFIPWERYGWTKDTIETVDRRIKDIVQLRGYK